MRGVRRIHIQKLNPHTCYQAVILADPKTPSIPCGNGTGSQVSVMRLWLTRSTDQGLSSSNHPVDKSRSPFRLFFRCSSGPPSSGPLSPQLPHVLVLPDLGRPELPHVLVNHDLGRRWESNLLHWVALGLLGSAGTSSRSHRWNIGAATCSRHVTHPPN